MTSGILQPLLLLAPKDLIDGREKATGIKIIQPLTLLCQNQRECIQVSKRESSSSLGMGPFQRLCLVNSLPTLGISARNSWKRVKCLVAFLKLSIFLNYVAKRDLSSLILTSSGLPSIGLIHLFPLTPRSIPSSTSKIYMQ